MFVCEKKGFKKEIRAGWADKRQIINTKGRRVISLRCIKLDGNSLPLLRFPQRPGPTHKKKPLVSVPRN